MYENLVRMFPDPPVEVAPQPGLIYERIHAIAEQVVIDHPGDLLEIGCYVGHATVLLASIAKRHNRRLLAVDPWLKDTQNCEGWEFAAWQVNTKPYQDVIDLVRLPSSQAVEEIRGRALSFAFLDGLHEHSATLGDLRAASHAAVICLDDCRWSIGIRNALTTFLSESKRGWTYLPRNREAWIWPLKESR